LASRFALNSHVLSIQGIEGSQTDKSQHAQLLSTDQATTSPIAEEDEGVETSTPPPHFEVTSPNQLPAAPREDVDREISVSDSDLDRRANQYFCFKRRQCWFGSTNYSWRKTIDRGYANGERPVRQDH